MRLHSLAASLILFASVPIAAAGQFGACTLAAHGVSTGTEPLDFVRLALRADGRPLLAYTTDVHNASSLHLYDCANPSCSAGHPVDLDISTNYFGAPDVVLRATGRPLAIASWLGGIRLYDCLDPACSEFGTTDLRPNGSGILSDLPLRLRADGRPVLLYVDGSLGSRPGQLVVHFCDDAACSTAGTERVLAVPPANATLSKLSLALAGDGTVAATFLVSEGASNLYDYHIARCTDAVCDNVVETPLSAPIGGSIPSRTALALRGDGRPLALDEQSAHRVLLDCDTPGCGTATDRPLPPAAEGQPFGLALLAGDRPAFALVGAGSLGAFACGDTTCTVGSAVTVAAPTSAILDGAFALDAGVRPALASIDFATRTLSVAGCDGDVLFVDGFD